MQRNDSTRPAGRSTADGDLQHSEAASSVKLSCDEVGLRSAMLRHVNLRAFLLGTAPIDNTGNTGCKSIATGFDLIYSIPFV